MNNIFSIIKSAFVAANKKELLVERIDKDEKQIALIVRSGYEPKGLEFFSTPELTQQIGIMVQNAGYKIQPHIHKKFERKIVGTGESLFILDGKVIVDIYDDEKNLIKTVDLSKGDFIYFIAGGHGFRFSKKTKILEVKQGPYIDDEKERF